MFLLRFLFIIYNGFADFVFLDNFTTHTTRLSPLHCTVRTQSNQVQCTFSQQHLIFALIYAILFSMYRITLRDIKYTALVYPFSI